MLDFEPRLTLDGHENEVKSIAWSANADYIASCSRDKTIWVYEQEEDDEYSCMGVLSGHEGDVKKVKWHPSQELLFSASYDDTIKCWSYQTSLEDWVCVYTMRAHTSTVWSIDFDPSGNFLASCSDDKSWVLWRISDKAYTKLATVSGDHFRSIYSISWAPEPIGGNHYIATCGADNQLCVYKVPVSELEAGA